MKSKWSLILKGTLLIAGIVGIVLNMIAARHFVQMISYYTIQSNLVIIGIFAYAFVRELNHLPHDSRSFLFIKNMATVGILITFLVYHFALKRAILESGVDYDPNTVNDILVHYVVPFLALLDALVFDIKGKIRPIDPILWLVQPFSYLLYTLIYVALGGFYQLGETVTHVPYFFLDVASIGISGVLMWMLIIVGMFVLLGYAYWGVDYLRRVDTNYLNHQTDKSNQTR